MVAELEFVRNPAPDAGKKTANPSSANQKPLAAAGQSRASHYLSSTLQALHPEPLHSSASQTPA